MSYIIGQYNHNSLTADDDHYINLIISGTVSRKTESGDTGVISDVANPFSDECITNLNLDPSNYYYFRGQIKRMTAAQTFSIKLINFEDSVTGSTEQFIKTITVQGGDRDEWVSVELIFHPIVAFDTILFQLQRTIDDYRIIERYPKIIYQELGIIQNIINDVVENGATLLKIGVQSHPGLTMCINGEEIHTSRSGIFELRNGVIPINFFSVVNVAKENTSAIEDMKNTINDAIDEIEGYDLVVPVGDEKPNKEGWYELINGIYVLTTDTVVNPDKDYYKERYTTEEKQEKYKLVNSYCGFGDSKTVVIDPFILDYMYNNE